MGKIKMSGDLPLIGGTVGTVIEDEGSGNRPVLGAHLSGDAGVAISGGVTATVEGGAATKPVRLTTPTGDPLEADVTVKGEAASPVGVRVEGGASAKPLHLTTPSGNPLEAAVTVQGIQGQAKEIGVGPLRIRLEKTKLVPDLTLNLTLLGTPFLTLTVKGTMKIEAMA